MGNKRIDDWAARMTEAALKAALARALEAALPGFVRIGHEDVRRSGVPDWSLTGAGLTTWWEFKVGLRPGEWSPRSRGIQLMTCRRLEAAGRCRYVVWAANGWPAIVARPSAVRAAVAAGGGVAAESGPFAGSGDLAAEMAKAHGVEINSPA